MQADLPKEWENLVWTGKDNFMRMGYAKTNVILWGCMQSLISSETTHLKSEITKMKNKMKGKDKDGSETESEKSNKKKNKNKSVLL